MVVGAKDSTTESIQRLTRLSKEAVTCVSEPKEPIPAYIERFFIPALAYLNLTSAGTTSAES